MTDTLHQMNRRRFSHSEGTLDSAGDTLSFSLSPYCTCTCHAYTAGTRLRVLILHLHCSAEYNCFIIIQAMCTA